MARFVLTLQCPDQPGIVNALTAGILDCGGNILTQAQFTDPALARFFLRTTFDTGVGDAEAVRDVILARLQRFDPQLSIRPSGQGRRIAIMVSTLDHCLVDLLYRRKVGELGADIAIVIGNHEVGRAETEAHGLPFVHLPVTAKTKPHAERRLLALLDEHQVDILVLARYMQILSDEFCRAMDGRVINIHHSFLPSFKGAQPYAQAHARGVELIGATAHFVTPDLDDGPIIDQAVHRVTHADTPADFAVIGRDVERQVLARAVRLVTEDRVLIAGGRTVTFA